MRVRKAVHPGLSPALPACPEGRSWVGQQGHPLQPASCCSHPQCASRLPSQMSSALEELPRWLLGPCSPLQAWVLCEQITLAQQASSILLLQCACDALIDCHSCWEAAIRITDCYLRSGKEARVTHCGLTQPCMMGWHYMASCLRYSLRRHNIRSKHMVQDTSATCLSWEPVRT